MFKTESKDYDIEYIPNDSLGEKSEVIQEGKKGELMYVDEDFPPVVSDSTVTEIIEVGPLHEKYEYARQTHDHYIHVPVFDSAYLKLGITTNDKTYIDNLIEIFNQIYISDKDYEKYRLLGDFVKDDLVEPFMFEFRIPYGSEYKPMGYIEALGNDVSLVEKVAQEDFYTREDIIRIVNNYVSRTTQSADDFKVDVSQLITPYEYIIEQGVNHQFLESVLEKDGLV